MVFKVVTDNGKLPTTRGGTGHRVGYIVGEPGQELYLQINPPATIPLVNFLPSSVGLPRAGDYHGECISCGKPRNVMTHRRFREGVIEVVVCSACNTVMKPAPMPQLRSYWW